MVLNISREKSNQLNTRLTVAEFFAGIGLMRLGLENKGWSVIFANDIDPKKHEMYCGHFGNTDKYFMLGDIHDMSADDVPDVTLATASFPCNDLSLAGGRKGLCGRHSSAFWGFIKVINQMGNRKPPLILLENVPGFLTSNSGKDFKEALISLNRLGYSVDVFMLDASRFVPQSRLRMFVIGVLDFQQKNVWEVREQLRFFESDIRPEALTHFILKHPEIRWKIRNLPPLVSNQMSLEDILEEVPEMSTTWWEENRAEYLLNQMSDRHRQIADRMINGSQFTYGTIFRRVRKNQTMAELRTDGIAGCLRTPRGGSARQILFKAGKGKYFVRLLTPRECARLMGAGEYNISVSLLSI